jgi:N-carbamoyl-L-amino-acid hydrolase
MVSRVETTARDLALPSRRLPSGMIFVPSVGGLSHNVREETLPEHLEAGAAVLMHAVMQLAD